MSCLCRHMLSSRMGMIQCKFYIIRSGTRSWSAHMFVLFLVFLTSVLVLHIVQVSLADQPTGRIFKV